MSNNKDLASAVPAPGYQPTASAADASSQSGIPDAVCRNCAGDGWVCENHLDTPWLGGEGCCGGAGSPCPVCQPEMANAPLIYSIAQEARRYAAFYPQSSDGRNTFEMFADFVETRAIAQAIEARRAATTGAVHESAVRKDAPTPEIQTLQAEVKVLREALEKVALQGSRDISGASQAMEMLRITRAALSPKESSDKGSVG